ncbi:MAG TPA: hypothetical protein VMU05_12215 [Dongiaceae bacterium]|nr:hypothetical protein [Dongiaceae bacterium]
MSQYLASQAGAQILFRGGSAIDAAMTGTNVAASDPRADGDAEPQPMLDR